MCSAQGKCINWNQCCCDEGYSGPQRQYSETVTCFGKDSIDVCSGYETCIANDTSSFSPSSQWEGSECQFPKCDGILLKYPQACNARGTCDAPDSCTNPTQWDRIILSNPDTCNCNESSNWGWGEDQISKMFCKIINKWRCLLWKLYCTRYMFLYTRILEMNANYLFVMEKCIRSSSVFISRNL